MTIWERVKTALNGLGVATAANTMVMATGAELPSVFITYQMISNPSLQHADDSEKMRSYRVQVSYYSRTGLAGMPNINGAMLAAGFQRLPGRELPYNRETRHFGLALDYLYVEEI